MTTLEKRYFRGPTLDADLLLLVAGMVLQAEVDKAPRDYRKCIRDAISGLFQRVPRRSSFHPRKGRNPFWKMAKGKKGGPKETWGRFERSELVAARGQAERLLASLNAALGTTIEIGGKGQ